MPSLSNLSPQVRPRIQTITWWPIQCFVSLEHDVPTIIFCVLTYEGEHSSQSNLLVLQLSRNYGHGFQGASTLSSTLPFTLHVFIWLFKVHHLTLVNKCQCSTQLLVESCCSFKQPSSPYTIPPTSRSSRHSSFLPHHQCMLASELDSE